MKYKKLICVGCLCMSFALTGCYNKLEYDNYHKEVNVLYEKIVSTDAKINNIDVDSDESVQDMFESLESLRVSFDDFANVEPPKEFQDCVFLSESASKYVSISEDYFHKALDGEYSDIDFKNGIANYNEVIKCVNYMGDVLQKKPQER